MSAVSCNILSLHRRAPVQVCLIKMIHIAGAIVLLFSITAEARVGNSSEPGSFCTETKECLLFDLVCEGEGYEVRHYDPAKWVSTEEESRIIEVAMIKAFRRLYKYITGENEAGAKIDMTTPVLVKVKENLSLMESSVYVLSFLLPSAYQESAPKPTDSTVYLSDMPDMKVYVTSFGGWAIPYISSLYSGQLKEALDNVQATYESGYRYNVGYNSPVKVFNRHNEIWYVVKGEPVCPKPE